MGFCALCKNLTALLVVLVAVAIGYVVYSPVPEGTFFWLIHQPMTFMDYYHNTLTPAVPLNLRQSPLVPPKGEIFLDLPGGGKMPASGLGMCCRGSAYHHESVKRSVLWYLLQGGRLIDTADAYVNHQAIGEAIKDAIQLGVKRSDIFVTTKVFPSKFGKKASEVFLKRALQELDLDYVDLVLLHAPIDIGTFVFKKGENRAFETFKECNSKKTCWGGTWETFAAAKEQGKVKHIGVSNFNVQQIQELTSLDIVKKHPIAANQVPFNPWVPKWQKDVVNFCQKNGIAVTGYYTLGGSLGKHGVAESSELQAIAKFHNVSVYLVLARWSLQNNVAIIPGTGKPHHMKSNLQVYDFALTEQQMETINGFKEDAPEAPMFMAISPPENA